MTEPSYLSEVRIAYDTVAVDYAELLQTELAGKPFDRAMLATFAELVTDGPVADLGCGPGRVTVHLQALGLTAFGVDLSPGMIAVARQAYPDLRFVEGSMLDLDLADGSLGGIVAWYSVIHTPLELLPAVFAEFHRVLAPGAPVLLAFQIGDELVRLEQGYGHTISMNVYRRSPDVVTELLSQAGLAVNAQLVREPVGIEKTRQAFLMACK